jgi:hypothetical protein
MALRNTPRPKFTVLDERLTPKFSPSRLPLKIRAQVSTEIDAVAHRDEAAKYLAFPDSAL